MTAVDPVRDSAPAVGVLLVLASTAAYAFAPVGAGVAYQDGSNPITVMILRGVVASALMALILVWRRESFRISRAAWRWSLWCGLLQTVTLYAFFESIALIPISLAILIFFAHPVLVAVLTHGSGGEPLTWRKLMLALLVLAGLAAALGTEVDALHPYGLVMASVSAVAVAGMILCAGRAQQDASSTQVGFYATAISSLAFAVIFAALGDWAAPQSLRGWIGILGTGAGLGIGLLALLVAFRYLSPVRATMLTSIEPLVTITLAAAVLGERLAPHQWMGAVLVVVALGLFEAASGGRSTDS